MPITLQFIRPYWLLALIPMLLVWMALYRQQDYFTRWSKVIAPHLLKHLIIHPSSKSQIKPIHTLLLLWFLVVASLSGPTFRNEVSPFADDQAGLFIVLKVTPSMMAKDIQPSRLERAKQKIHDLLVLRESAATGLIVYSGSAHLVMPLTRDDRIIDTMLEGIAPGIMPKDGDALIQALNRAGDLFKNMDKTGSILVVADTIAPSEVAAASKYKETNSDPIQILATIPENSELNQGLKEFSSITKSTITRMTLDEADLNRISKSITHKMKQISNKENGTRPRDAGYFLLPLIALCALMWARRGWVIK